jgi:hypothetical protein
LIFDSDPRHELSASTAMPVQPAPDTTVP